MTPVDLATACKTAIEAGLRYVALTLPGEAPPFRRVRLAPRGTGKCPLGEVACWTERAAPLRTSRPWTCSRGSWPREIGNEAGRG